MAAALRLVFAVIVFGLSLLAVFPAPTYRLWMASIAVTEAGYFLALLSLLVFLPGWRKSGTGKLSALIAIFAFCLSLSPIVRARLLARDLPSKMRAAFGLVTPRSLPGAMPTMQPLRFASLITRPAAPGVQKTTMNYIVRDGRPLELDLYRRNEGSAPKPLVIVIHGGSWTGGTRADLPSLNYYLAARGYAVATVSYRFAPAFRHPSQTEDVNAAIDYLKANAAHLGFDGNRIALIGRSAGGQLALISAYSRNDPSVRGVVSFYGATDLKWGWDNPANPHVYNSSATLRSFLGGSPAEKPDAYRTASAVNYMGSHIIPTLMIHGDKDELVSVTHSVKLDSALASAGQPRLLIRLPWGTHGCDYVFNGPCGQVSTYAVERFLAAVLR